MTLGLSYIARPAYHTRTTYFDWYTHKIEFSQRDMMSSYYIFLCVHILSLFSLSSWSVLSREAPWCTVHTFRCGTIHVQCCSAQLECIMDALQVWCTCFSA